jgi:hypothetical protein
MTRRVRPAAVCLLAVILCGCDILQDSNPRPWIGYAYNKDSRRFEWEFNSWATLRDCKESMLNVVEARPGMSEPVGCGYRGNNYSRVWIMNMLWGGSQIECITRMTKAVETEGGTGFNVKLKGSPDRRGDGWYCM